MFKQPQNQKFSPNTNKTETLLHIHEFRALRVRCNSALNPGGRFEMEPLAILRSSRRTDKFPQADLVLGDNSRILRAGYKSISRNHPVILNREQSRPQTRRTHCLHRNHTEIPTWSRISKFWKTFWVWIPAICTALHGFNVSLSRVKGSETLLPASLWSSFQIVEEFDTEAFACVKELCKHCSNPRMFEMLKG